jgi:diguanylate cyclase (GGDEF)-like protein/PAS domain S-box-containing protein
MPQGDLRDADGGDAVTYVLPTGASMLRASESLHGSHVFKTIDLRSGRRLARSWPFRNPGLRIALIVSTVALVLAASAITADRVTTQVKQTAVDEAAQGAAAIVGSFVAPLLSEEVMHDTGSSTGRAINAELERLVESGYFLRIKIWDPSGTVLFSDKPELRGRQFEVEADLDEAFDGKVESDITDATADENIFEHGLATRLLEIYSPVRLASTGKVVAAYEIYRDASAIEAGLDATRRDVFLIAGAMATALTVLLIIAFDGTARRMRRQNGRLQTLTRTLRDREARFRSLVQNASDLFLVVSREGTIRYESPAVERILGFEPSARIGGRVEGILHPDDVSSVTMLLGTIADEPGTDVGGEARLAHRDGSWRVFEWTARNLFEEPSVEGLVVNAHDVTERTALEEQLRHQAFHDPLTGLANRALFSDRVGHALSRRRRERQMPAVLFLDLDDFKTVNDTLGHGQGDRLLVEVARRISDSIRPEDTACRLSGDEFAVLLDEIGDVDRAADVASRVLQRISDPIVIDRELSVTASLGLAMVDAEVREIEDVLSRADVAMYAAKAAGKARMRTYEPAMRDRAWTRLELESELRRAVERGEFSVVYQPIVDLPSGRTVELEALVRWDHPRRGRLAPDAFLGAAEETGLIIPLGRLVLEEACRDVRGWQAARPGRPLGLSVNLSSRQFLDPALPETLRSVLDATGLDGDSLKLEITESAMVDAETSDLVMRRIRSMGIRLAVDDFGTGYSGLSYFQRFPLDTLKIDRSFVARMGRDARSDAIVNATIAFGKALGLTVTAEGIETAEQLEGLRASGADRGQGYLFSMPLEAADVGAYLAATSDAVA